VALEVPDASALAVRALDDPDSFVRTIAARALEDLADPAAASALAARLVEDEDWRVRRAAADALPRAGGEEAVAALTAGLEDPVKEVRLGAVRGLGKLAPDAGFEILCRMMIEDPEWEVRVQVAAVLGGAGRPEATPVLEQASRDPNEFVRAAVAKALRTGRQEPAPGPSE
jgi:HEAT repeat protein